MNETLEQAGERLYPNKESFLHRFQNIERKAFTAGAEWQQEKDKNKYSEEEVYKLLCTMPNFFNMTIPQQLTARDEWFEQFKKK
jgi:hypothetical protein